MPLSAPPIRGYPDGQRVSNYDSGTLWSTTSVLGNSTITSPILDISRYAYLGGFIACISGQCSISFEWSTSSTFATVTATRVMQLSVNITNGMQLRVPNLAPFCQIVVTAIVGGNFRIQTNVFGTNRVHPLEFIPQNQVLIDQQTVTIVNGPTPYYPSDHYAGPILVWTQVPVASVNINLQSLNAAGTWDFMYQSANLGAATNFNVTLITPSGAWRLLAQNTGASTAGFYLSAIQSTSGAA